MAKDYGQRQIRVNVVAPGSSPSALGQLSTDLLSISRADRHTADGQALRKHRVRRRRTAAERPDGEGWTAGGGCEGRGVLAEQ